jgi:perosamine synthetase
MIPVCEPTLQGNELKYATEAVSSGWISSAGTFVKKFEENFASYCGVKHGISCANGTAALHLGIEALGIGKGDEVIIPTFTMIASANAVIYAGAKPVLIDSELTTWNLNINRIEEKITPKTKAIMVVHTYGHPVDMDRIKVIADKHNLKIIEDAAEAHGAEYNGKKAGSLSDVACFSFYGNKIITTGEGGMVITNNNNIADRARLLRNHAFSVPRFTHYELGYNYRMTNVQAAIGCAQLEQIETFVNARRKNARIYNTALAQISGITIPPEASWAKNVYWMYGILINEEQFGMSMQQLRAKLKEKGIDTRTFFVGMHNQPVYTKDDPRYPDVTGDYPVADRLEKTGLYLPSSSHLTNEQATFITQTIKELHENKNEQ